MTTYTVSGGRLLADGVAVRWRPSHPACVFVE